MLPKEPDKSVDKVRSPRLLNVALVNGSHSLPDNAINLEWMSVDGGLGTLSISHPNYRRSTGALDRSAHAADTGWSLCIK